MIKKSSLLVFFRAQFSAYLGGMVDYLTMIICTEWLHIHYTISIAIGGIVGAIVNFTMNRNWTFQANAQGDSALLQLFKFGFMVGGSILLKSAGTYLLTGGTHLDYKISRIMIDILVSLGFNYTLQRYWVFRKRTS